MSSSGLAVNKKILTIMIKSHPLSPLNLSEISSVVDIIRRTKGTGRETRFISVALKEPSKQKVREFSKNPGLQIDREAFIVLFDNSRNECYEAIVDIDHAALISWTIYPGVQPTMSSDEQIECEQAVLKSEAFRDALKKYGVTDTSLVMVDIWSAGYYGSPEGSHHAPGPPLCFLRADAKDNGYAHPIEGVRPVVDLNTMTVIRVEEYDYVEVPPLAGNYAANLVENLRTDIKPLEIVQPEGPGFSVNGYEVSWQKWNFVIGFNPREGLTLHQLTYNDRGEKKVYPLPGIAFRNGCALWRPPRRPSEEKMPSTPANMEWGPAPTALELGCDCLGFIKYFDANMTDSKGTLLTIKNAICMHEEDYGILWKHTDRRIGAPEVRRSRRLVISFPLHRRKLRIWVFLVPVSGRKYPLEIKLTRYPLSGRISKGRQTQIREPRSALFVCAQPPALLQCALRFRS